MVLAFAVVASILITVVTWLRFGLQNAATLVGLAVNLFTVPALALSLLDATRRPQHPADAYAHGASSPLPRDVAAERGGMRDRRRIEISLEISTDASLLRRAARAVLLAVIVVTIVAVVRSGAGGSGFWMNYS